MKCSILSLVFFSSFIITSCTSSHLTPENTVAPNQDEIVALETPVANAGSDLTAIETTKVQLSGMGTDIDGLIVLTLWEQVAGTTVILSDNASSNPTFIAPSVAEILRFKFTVTDDANLTHSDTVDITIVRNVKPIAMAGDDLIVSELEEVTINGSATDSDGSIASYLWTQTSGTNISISNSSSATLIFTAPENAQTLVFQLTATDDLGLTHFDSVSVSVQYLYDPAPVISTKTYTQTDSISFAPYSQCTTYEPNFHTFNLTASYNEMNVGPFALFWGNDYSLLDSDTANILTLLKTDATLQQNTTDNLDAMLNTLIDKYNLDITPSVSANDGKCYRVNLYFYGTGLWTGDTILDYGGATRCEAYVTIPNPNKIPIIELSAGNLKLIAEANNVFTFTLAHEYTHVLQCRMPRGDTTGWSWYIESLAQFFSNDVNNANVFSASLINENFLSLDAFFNRYASSPFWMYTRYEFGDAYMGDIFKRVSYVDESLMQFLLRTAPFNCAGGDTVCAGAAFANFYGRFAASSVNYASSTTDEGIDYYGGLNLVAGSHRKSAQMQKITNTRYRISDWIAPQRYAHNIIELIPDPNNKILTIKLDGWNIPLRNSQWRATVIATTNETSMSRAEVWGEMFTSGTQVIDLNQWETDLGVTIKKLHIVIAATPLTWLLDADMSAFDSPLRHDEMDQYIYELTIDGAWPSGHEPESLRSTLTVAGAAHSNGGGFVAATATVDPTAYVGLQARILDSAQVLGNARIEGRAIIRDNAIVQGNAIVSSEVEMMGNATASGYATIRDNIFMGDTASVAGSGKLSGDSYVYGTFSITNKAAAIGAPVIWTTSQLTLSGTAIINGHTWFGNNTYTMGTPYDNWATNDNGLFLHYDFSEIHPYRINDSHVNSDAYYLDTDGKQGNEPVYVMDSVISSQVLTLDGTGYIELPKLVFDFHDYQFELMVNWQGSGTHYLLDTSSDRNEKLSVKLISVGSDIYDVQLFFNDRNGNNRQVLLQSSILKTNDWIKLAINFSSATSTIKITATTLSGISSVEASAILPTETREFNYDSLFLRLGSNIEGTKPFQGRIDDVKLIRQ